MLPMRPLDWRQYPQTQHMHGQLCVFRRALLGLNWTPERSPCSHPQASDHFHTFLCGIRGELRDSLFFEVSASASISSMHWPPHDSCLGHPCGKTGGGGCVQRDGVRHPARGPRRKGSRLSLGPSRWYELCLSHVRLPRLLPGQFPSLSPLLGG